MIPGSKADFVGEGVPGTVAGGLVTTCACSVVFVALGDTGTSRGTIIPLISVIDPAVTATTWLNGL